MKSVCVTGATSFTGAWIAAEFASQGWHTFALCREDPQTYQDLKARRLQVIGPNAELVGPLNAESPEILTWIRKNKPSVWVHHHHHMDNYRGAAYDYAKFEASCLEPLERLVTALSESNCRGIVYSGTFFEPDEGGSDRPEPTLYARSKKKVWEALEDLCVQRNLLLSKVVIPDPIGPLENADRLIPTLIEKARRHESLNLNQPLARGDHLPVFALAKKYLEVAEKILEGKSLVVRPSGWKGPNALWISEVSKRLLVKELSLLEVEIKIPPGAESLTKNLSYENPSAEKILLNWEEVWSRYAQFHKE